MSIVYKLKVIYGIVVSVPQNGFRTTYKSRLDYNMNMIITKENVFLKDSNIRTKHVRHKTFLPSNCQNVRSQSTPQSFVFVVFYEDFLLLFTLYTSMLTHTHIGRLLSSKPKKRIYFQL